MRKKKHPEHVNHERWLISYADFITLLFAFFVVMFAVSQVDSKRVGRFTEEFSKAVGIEVFPNSGKGLLAGTDVVLAAATKGKEEGTFPADLEVIESELATRGSGAAKELQGLQTLRKRNELVLRLPENIVFDSGEDVLKQPAVKMLKTIAAALKPKNVDIRVEGHTDNKPISNSRFRSNWDLSTLRATAVIKCFSAEGIASERLGVTGYGEFRPIAPNTTPEGRKQNRRVDLVVSATVFEMEPAKTTPAKTEAADHATGTNHPLTDAGNVSADAGNADAVHGTPDAVHESAVHAPGPATGATDHATPHAGEHH